MMEVTQELKQKFEKDFVIIYRGRYFGLSFKDKEIREVTFEDAYGCSFFDWDNNICIASDYLKQRYKEARGEDGCGLSRFFNKRNDLKEMQDKSYEEYEAQIQRNKVEGGEQ